MITIAFVAYGFVCLVFLTETFLEGKKEQAGWDSWRVGGLVLSLVWPLYALAVLAAALGRCDPRSVPQCAPTRFRILVPAGRGRLNPGPGFLRSALKMGLSIE